MNRNIFAVFADDSDDGVDKFKPVEDPKNKKKPQQVAQ
jgi:hypothetical protein